MKPVHGRGSSSVNDQARNTQQQSLLPTRICQLQEGKRPKVQSDRLLAERFRAASGGTKKKQRPCRCWSPVFNTRLKVRVRRWPRRMGRKGAAVQGGFADNAGAHSTGMRSPVKERVCGRRLGAGLGRSRSWSCFSTTAATEFLQTQVRTRCCSWQRNWVDVAVDLHLSKWSGCGFQLLAAGKDEAASRQLIAPGR